MAAFFSVFVIHLLACATDMSSLTGLLSSHFFSVGRDLRLIKFRPCGTWDGEPIFNLRFRRFLLFVLRK
jgi:hypothetical protein